MASYPRLPNKESIRAQLKELGYSNVPDEVLDEFMMDMAKLYQNPSSDPYGWSTEESDYEKKSGERHRNVRVSNEGAHHVRAEQQGQSRGRGNTTTSRSHQHYQETSEYSDDNRQYQQSKHQQSQHQQYQQSNHQQTQYQQHQQYQRQPVHRVHNPTHDYNYQRPTHYQPHEHSAYRTSESEYETESAGEGVYDGETYMPSSGIHISPHQRSAYSHSSSDEKENYYRHGHHTHSSNHSTHNRQQPPSSSSSSYAPVARKPAQVPRHHAPVYNNDESDYSSAAQVNDEYYTSDEPYYRDAPYPYYKNTSHQYNSTSNDEYYSEDDTESLPLSSMSGESRYPGVKPNSSGVIWAKKSDNGRAYHRSDPVSRYHEVQRAWSNDPFLRSQSSNKNPKVHIPYEPPWKPPRKDLSLMRPDYVVPTEKRRDSLRFSVRAKMMS